MTTNYTIEGNELKMEQTTMAYPLQDVIQQMVDSMRERTNDNTNQMFQRMCSRSGYLKETRTIRIAGGRRWGHTTAALSVVGRGNTLYLAPMWAMCERAQQVLRELFPTHQAQLHIGTIGATYIACRGYECILVDSASLALKEEAMLDALYVMAETALNPDGFLLLVG